MQAAPIYKSPSASSTATFLPEPPPLMSQVSQEDLRELSAPLEDRA